jgi:hypothetical protein
MRNTSNMNSFLVLVLLVFVGWWYIHDCRKKYEGQISETESRLSYVYHQMNWFGVRMFREGVNLELIESKLLLGMADKVLNSHIIDAWGEEFIINYKMREVMFELTVRSKGRDKVLGTEDDIWRRFDPELGTISFSPLEKRPVKDESPVIRKRAASHKRAASYDKQ